MGAVRAAILGLSLAVFGVFAAPGAAGEPVSDRPAIAIVIDDLGQRPALDRRAIGLPGAVTCAFLPHAPYAARLADIAGAGGCEIMVHLPMEALDPALLHPGMLDLDMTRREFVRVIRDGLDALPAARGVNNHMGSLLTQSRMRMGWLMDELRRHEHLYFVDSYTSERSVAWDLALEADLPSARRDVFIDATREPGAIHAEFERLLAQARANGTALGIGHPYPETLTYLETRLATLADDGVDLVPVSALIERRAHAARVRLAAPGRAQDNVALAPEEAGSADRP